jgi:hypothetical protein
MAVWRLNEMIGPAFLPAIMLVGVPVLDMTLVIVSRARRRAPIGRGARDHITHRLLPKLGSTWAVAAVLAIAQGALSLAAIEVMGWNRGAILAGAAVAFVLGVVTIAILESSAFRPEPPRRSSRLGDAIPGAGRSAQASRSTGDSWGVVATSTPGRRTTSGGSPSRTERGS